MQPNPSVPAPRKPVKLPQGTRGPQPAGQPQGPAQRPASRPTTSFRDDPPPGMGGGEATRPNSYGAHQAGYVHQQPLQPPVQVGSMNVKAFGGMGLGALLVVGGIVATYVSYESAGPGGRYTLWWGPMLFGAITFLGGVAALFKK